MSANYTYGMQRVKPTVHEIDTFNNTRIALSGRNNGGVEMTFDSQEENQIVNDPRIP